MIHAQVEADTRIEVDVCIVGGGAAAVSVALRLIETGNKIALLVGGGEHRESVSDQDLNRGGVVRAGTHESLEENRRRQFGGATSAWGGRCIPFDAIDFEERSWMPASGWPVTAQEMEPFVQRATRVCRAGEPIFDSRVAFPNESPEIIPGMDSADLESWHLERWSPPINFAVEYREQLEAPNVDVYLNTHLIGLRAETQSEKVDFADAVSNGKRLEVKARYFVVATGGIENARLLLTSRGRLHPNGLGNDHDLVGRYYQSHPMGIFATVELKSKQLLRLGYERDTEGVYCRRRWWIAEQTQRRLGIGNIVFFLARAAPQSGHRDALFSAVFLAKALLRVARTSGMGEKKKQLQDPTFREHMKTVVRQGPGIIPTLWQVARGRGSKRRLPSVLPESKSSFWGVFFQAEQTPIYESRITLSPTEHDAHGMPRAVVDMQFSDLDQKTIVEGYRIFAERFQTANAGTILHDRQDIIRQTEAYQQAFNSSAHHIGTTRMASSAQQGVVDSDCRVFGMENLFLAGASIFPTGGHANPTLMIVAFALRLGDRLAHLLTRVGERR